METNELMLGDIIKSSHLGVIGKVCTLNSNDVTVNAIDDENNYYFGSIDAWEGVPLTEDILVLNGWHRDKSVIYLHNNIPDQDHFIRHYHGNTYWMFDDRFLIEYVNELQQLLRRASHSGLADDFKIK